MAGLTRFRTLGWIAGALVLLALVFVLPAMGRVQSLALSDWPKLAQAAAVAPGSSRVAVDVAVEADFLPPGQVRLAWLDAAGRPLGETEARLPVEFRWDSEPRLDRAGNELKPRRLAAPLQRDLILRTADGTADVAVPAGAASVQWRVLPAGLLVVSTRFAAAAALPTVATASVEPLFLEAERAAVTSDPSVPPDSLRDPSLSPYDSDHLRLNAVSAKTWKVDGQALVWEFTVDTAGPRELWLRSRQADRVNGGSFRGLRLDGVPVGTGLTLVPARADWTAAPLADLEGRPVVLPLTAGTHRVELAATKVPLASVLGTVVEVENATRDLGLQLRSLTGDTQDQLRDWKLDDYLPGVGDAMVHWADELAHAHDILAQQFHSTGETREGVNLRIASERLRQLAIERDKLPYRRSWLSEGSGSVTGLLVTTQVLLEAQPLDLDWIALVGPGQVPKRPELSLVTRWQDSLRRFWLSFAPAQYGRRDQGADLAVWVNRPRAQAELIQQMADEEVPELGARISLIPDEGKILLANAAGRVPDVGLGISNWLPFELGLRGALKDLRTEPGFTALARQFSPGAFLPLVIRNQVFAFPETQNFWVTFYRKDILAKLGVTPPDTWSDLVNLVPTLRRAGLQVFLPIAGGAGFKSFPQTLPFVNQAGGRLYKPDGSGTDLASEESLAGLRFLAQMFTLYSLPLQVPVFYDHFKDGSIPLGIGDAATYVQLASAADELAGLWEVAPQPGMKDGTGQVVRWAPGSGSTAVIFEGAKHPEGAWTFLTWWLSADTQARYAQRLLATYGPTYLWFSANLAAFQRLPLPAADKRAILDQWKWLREAPKMPGTYMVERQMSDAWNRMVFNGTNPREAVDQAALSADREVLRRLAEFGWVAAGKLVRPWPVADLDTIQTLLGTQP